MRRRRERILLEAVAFPSAHGLLKGCGDDAGWRNAGEPCAAPEWTPERHRAVSHTLGEEMELELTLKIPEGGEAPPAPAIVGEGPEGLRLDGATARRGPVAVHSTRPLSRKIEKEPRRPRPPRAARAAAIHHVAETLFRAPPGGRRPRIRGSLGEPESLGGVGGLAPRPRRFELPHTIDEGACFSTDEGAEPLLLAAWTERVDGGVRGGQLYFLFYKKVPQRVGFRSDERWFDDPIRRRRGQPRSRPGP